jgi:hypothetical protein
MSIVLQGSTSGSVTLQEPAIAGTTVLDLPATSGTILTSSSSLSSFPSGFANGITENDQWYLTTNTAISSVPFVITNNLSRVNTGNFSLLGTGMSQSSGVFTFPSIGRWNVVLQLLFYENSGSGNTRVSSAIQLTTNNSSYSDVILCHGFCGIYSVEENFTQFTFNITDTANQKIRFAVTGKDGVANIYGGSGPINTMMSFTKIGS